MSGNILPMETGRASKGQLVARFASKFGVDQRRLFDILKATAFKQRDGSAPTDEQMAALLIVADQYNLNPFTKEIYAFPDKQNGIVPVVGVDGWMRILNEHPQFDGLEIKYSETTVLPDGGRECPEWVEVMIHRKDRTRPVIIREYLDEVYRPPIKTKDGRLFDGPWQSHTKRFLRHKGIIQAARIAFGFAGIHDPDEAETVMETIEADFRRLPSPPPADPQVDEEEAWGRLRAAVRVSKVPEDRLRVFVEATAEANGLSSAEIMVQGAARPAEFMTAYKAWDRKNPVEKESGPGSQADLFGAAGAEPEAEEPEAKPADRDLVGEIGEQCRRMELDPEAVWKERFGRKAPGKVSSKELEALLSDLIETEQATAGIDWDAAGAFWQDCENTTENGADRARRLARADKVGSTEELVDWARENRARWAAFEKRLRSEG